MGSQVSNSINTAGAANAQMYSDIGNINAQQSMSGWNAMLDVGNMIGTYFGGKR
jgi:hypothetical protein